ncbi:MAG TPA: hypothetical protein VFV26_00140 [Geothrix sp.]|nr:hypothetical protein [Geothrix sp.]
MLGSARSIGTRLFLATGQAIRNIVLDPSNPKAFQNYEAALETTSRIAESIRREVGQFRV